MSGDKKLFILWPNDNLHTSQLRVMKYATNAMLNHWWEEVTVIVWGATVRLAAENAAIQERIKMAQHAGVVFSACVDCVNQFGAAETFKTLGIEAAPWGAPLTALIHGGEHLICV